MFTVDAFCAYRYIRKGGNDWLVSLLNKVDHDSVYDYIYMAYVAALLVTQITNLLYSALSQGLRNHTHSVHIYLMKNNFVISVYTLTVQLSTLSSRHCAASLTNTASSSSATFLSLFLGLFIASFLRALKPEREREVEASAAHARLLLLYYYCRALAATRYTLAAIY